MIREQLTKTVTKVVETFSAEVYSVEEEIIKLNESNEDFGLNRHVRTLLMVHHNRCRLDNPLRDLSLMDFQLFNSQSGSQTLKHKSKIHQQLQEIETVTIALCQRELDEKLTDFLTKNLLRKSNTSDVSYTVRYKLLNKHAQFTKFTIGAFR